jgi:hypothetical protein
MLSQVPYLSRVWLGAKVSTKLHSEINACPITKAAVSTDGLKSTNDVPESSPQAPDLKKLA